MKYTYELIYPNGETERSDEVFNSREDAENAAVDECLYATGEETLSMMIDSDYEPVEGECEYKIIELEE